MTVKTEGQYKGEHVVSLFNGGAEEGGDISLENGTYASGHGTVKDGTVLALSGGLLIPATGSVDTAGDSDEDVVGTAYGNFDTTAAVKGPYVARLAVVDTSLLTTSGTKSALVAALAKLFIIAR